MINAVTKKLAKKLGAESFMSQDNSEDNISKVSHLIYLLSLVCCR